VLQNRTSRNLFGAITMASAFFRGLLDVLVHALFLLLLWPRYKSLFLIDDLLAEINTLITYINPAWSRD
jgi:hypothetical protein